MSRIECPGMDGSNPLHFLASLGVLRLLARSDSSTRMGWMLHRSRWIPFFERRAEAWSLADAAQELQNWIAVLGRTKSSDPVMQREVRDLSARLKQLREARKKNAASLTAELKKSLTPKDIRIAITEKLAPEDREISELQSKLTELQCMVGDTLGDGVAHLGDIIGIDPQLFRLKARRAASTWLERLPAGDDPHVEDPDLVAACLAALGSDQIVSGGKVANTPFSFANGSSGQCLLKDFREAACNASLESTLGAISGIPIYSRALSSLGWDPADQSAYALQWQAPEVTNKKGNKKVDPSLQTLGYLGLSLLPAMPGQSRLSAQSWREEPDQKGFCWPIWTAPLDLDVVFSLLGLSDRPDRKTPGIEALHVSWVQNPNGKRNFFAPARSL